MWLEAKGMAEVTVCETNQCGLEPQVLAYDCPSPRPYAPFGVKVPPLRLLRVPKEVIDAEQLRVRKQRWPREIELVQRLETLLRDTIRVPRESSQFEKIRAALGQVALRVHVLWERQPLNVCQIAFYSASHGTRAFGGHRQVVRECSYRRIPKERQCGHG